MYKNHIAFIFLLIPAFLFLQGCQENTLPPETGNMLQVPRLLYPPNDTTDVDVPMTFSWNGGRNIKNYTLQVSDDSLFRSLVYSQNGRTTTVRDVTGFSNKTKYYWRVNAINGYGESKCSTIWSFTTGKFCPGTPTIDYFGKIYKTVQIDNQCWLRENLDVGTIVKGSDYQLNNGIIEKYCYNDSTEYCNIYGGLYLWNEAMQYSHLEGAQGICPPGWHIPTSEEFQILNMTVGGDGNALKAIGQGTDSGAGTNTSGFSALLSGFRISDGYFIYLSWWTCFYSSNVDHIRLFSYNNNIILVNRSAWQGLSIRCLKD